MIKKLTLLLLFMSFLANAQVNYHSRINKISEFTSLQGEPLNDKIANLQSVKVVYDVAAKKVYFFNSKKFKYHHEFCEEILGYSKDLSAFNEDNYSNKKQRTYLLANLNFMPESKIWFLELAASDFMIASNVEILFKAVQKQVYFKNELVFYLNSPRLMSANQLKPFSIPVVFSDFIFKNSSEQSIESGTSIGTLAKYDVLNTKEFQPKSNEIIVINATPLLIPEVKGIIVTEFQTPLSHLVLLAKNRNIPVYVDKNAWENTKINALVGKNVELKVTKSMYSLSQTNKKESKPIQLKWITLQPNYNVKNIFDLNESVLKNGETYIGSKAQNLAILHQISIKNKRFKTPEYAFAIPFYYYQNHILQHGIQPKIDSLLACNADSIQQRNHLLKSIRKAIKKAEVDTELLQLVTEKLSKQKDFTHFKFRSSTNAEDIEGFNGAGLYDSKSAILGDSIKTISKAITEVWSSLWNKRAFLEREIFRIDHRSCAMGILVHRSFPDELANGVVISENIYRKKYKGITVNVQKGEVSVVNPDAAVTCDEFYVHNFNFMDDTLSIDYRSLSSLNDHVPLLSESEIKTVFDVVLDIERNINAVWKKNKTTKSYRPIDVEVKWEGTHRTFYIKQVRVYMD